MKTVKSLLFLLVIGLLVGSVTACRRSGTAAAKPEGTATEDPDGPRAPRHSRWA